MTKKEIFLSIKTYEEYDKRRAEFEKLDFTDKEILAHYDELFPQLKPKLTKNGVHYDLRKL